MSIDRCATCLYWLADDETYGQGRHLAGTAVCAVWSDSKGDICDTLASDLGLPPLPGEDPPMLVTLQHDALLSNAVEVVTDANFGCVQHRPR